MGVGQVAAGVAWETEEQKTGLIRYRRGGYMRCATQFSLTGRRA